MTGVRSNAASFTRSASQYLLVSAVSCRKIADAHRLALVRPPPPCRYGSAERAFLLETTPEGVISAGNAGYAVSLGFLAGATPPDRISLSSSPAPCSRRSPS
ncbi:MAG: hypothetical protein U1F77_10150 [Kiritimatiellia bacterium]